MTSHAPPRWFEWMVSIGALWTVAGVHLDGWAHLHQPGLETFFTPWHGVLYAGFGFTALTLALGLVARRASAASGGPRVPAGYLGAYIGAATFLLGGVGDMAWHTRFGIEESVDALFSPTHILLAVGMAMIAAAPIRRAWRTAGAPVGQAAWAPVLLGTTALLGVLTFFTQVIHPYSRAWSSVGNQPTEAVFPMVDAFPPAPGVQSGLLSTDVAGIAGISGYIIQTLFLCAVLLPLVRRWRLPFGTVTFVVGLDILLLTAMRDQVAIWPAALVATLACDGFLLFAQLPDASTRAFRVFGALVPATLWTAQTIVTAATQGLGWPVSMWSGGVLIGALIGWGMTYVIAPDAGPTRLGPQPP